MRAFQERRCRRASARSFQRTPDSKHSRGFQAGRRTEKGPEGYEPGELLDPDNYTAPPGEGWPFRFVVPHLYFGPSLTVSAGDDYATLFDSQAYQTPGATWAARHEKDRLQGLAGAYPLPPLWVSELNTRYGLYYPAVTENERNMLNASFPHNHRLKSALGAAVVQLELAAIDALGSNLFLAANVQDGNAWNGQALRMIVGDKIGKLATAPYLPVERGWVTPHFYAQKLLNAYAVGTADATDCSNPAIYAQSFRNDNNIAVFLINKDPAAAHSLRVATGAQPETPVFAVTLSGSAGMESNNECTADGRADEVGWPTVTVMEPVAGPLAFEAPPASMTVIVAESVEPTFEIAGYVVAASGQPLAGVTVEANSGTPYTTITDEYGLYRITDVPRGIYDVSVTNAGGYIPIIQEAEVSDQTPYPVNNFTLTPRLSGTVKRWNAQQTELLPVPGAAVWVEPSGGGAVLASTTTDCEGSFVLPVASGTYRLDAAHTSFGNPDHAAVDVTQSAACYTIVLADFADPTACE